MADTANPKYINWLRCASSLAELKQNLHACTQEGVIRLHKDITRNVNIDIGQSSECKSCRSSNIKKQSGWIIICRICSSWLKQILRKHREPNSNTINWSNSDITKWSTEPWEIAKIFMPKGQWYNPRLPETLDITAILSLHKYCNEFCHENLVSDIIEIRNTLFHSSALSVEETDKNNWIDKMLEFLSQLKINGNARRAIEKLKNEDTTFPKERQLVQEAMSELEAGMKELKQQLGSFEKAQRELIAEAETSKARGANTEALQILQKRQEELESELQGHRNQERKVYSAAVSRLQGVAGDNPDLVETVRLQAAINEIKILRAQIEKNETIFGHLKNLLSSLWDAIKSNCVLQ